jgi:hypothetical protein
MFVLICGKLRDGPKLVSSCFKTPFRSWFKKYLEDIYNNNNDQIGKGWVWVRVWMCGLKGKTLTPTSTLTPIDPSIHFRPTPTIIDPSSSHPQLHLSHVTPKPESSASASTPNMYNSF